MVQADQPVLRANKAEVFGWAMFDFANSSYTTVITTAFFTPYFVNQIVGGAKGDSGWQDGTFLRGVCESVSQGIVLLLAPLLGALADFSGAKKTFLQFTWLGCAIFTVALGALQPGDVVLAMILLICANICFASGENFISAFLPEIAPSASIGRISGLAWGIGYLGGIGSLLLAVLILNATDETGYRWVWVMTGFWFLFAGLPTFILVRERHLRDELPKGTSIWSIGFVRIAATLREARKYRQLFRFLGIFAIFNCGAAAVIVFASTIATNALHFNSTQLGRFLIVTNVTAAVGAFLGGYLSDRITARRTLMLSLSGWLTAALIVAFVTKPTHEGSTPPEIPTHDLVLFWIAGTFVGLSMGMTYATSRGLIGAFSPVAKSGEFFGLWGMALRLSQLIGPLWFGWAASERHLGERWTLASLGGFFLAGLLLLYFFVDEQEGRRVAGHACPAPANPSPVKMPAASGTLPPSAAGTVTKPSGSADNDVLESRPPGVS